jgi:hypothetical protein
MFYLSKADVAVLVVEMRDAVLAAGILRTIKASTAHHGSQLSYGKPKELMVHDVVDAFLLVGNRIFQSNNQSFGYLSQEDTTLCTWIEKLGVGTSE